MGRSTKDLAKNGMHKNSPSRFLPDLCIRIVRYNNKQNIFLLKHIFLFVCYSEKLVFSAVFGLFYLCIWDNFRKSLEQDLEENGTNKCLYRDEKGRKPMPAAE